MIWAIVSTVALMMFLSLAVDLARVQLAKTELQRAADAAARYGAKGLSDSSYVSKAQAAASDNTCDGASVSLQAGDIVAGSWASGTFTAGGGSPNALQVTAYRTSARGNATPLMFARVLGLRSCDLTATSIARITLGPPYGVIGLNSVTVSGGGGPRIDSYNSSSGSYSTSTSLANGDIGTNGTITLGGSAVEYGDAYYKTGFSTSGTAMIVAPGAAHILSTTLSYPAPSLPTSYTDLGNLSGSGIGSMTLTAGNYYFSSIVTSNSYILRANGRVNIYVGGTLSVGGNSCMIANVPQDLHVYVTGAGPVSVTNSGTFTGRVYAPSAPFSVVGNGILYGSVIAASVAVNNSGAIHVDEALGFGTGTISMMK